MSCTKNAIYQGEDKDITLVLPEPFAGLSDVIVGVRIGNDLLKTCKKTSSGAQAVTAVQGEANKCVFKLLRSETASWTPGHLIFEVTLVSTRDGYPEGYHTTQVFTPCRLEPLKTATA